jgi:CheY-like chemotaxis protein
MALHNSMHHVGKLEKQMRILIADNEVCRVLNSQILARLATYGSVDIVQNGHDAVVTYTKTGSTGIFYDMVVLDRHLTALGGFTAVEMIRIFERDHRRSGKRTMVCVISNDDLLPQQQEIRFGKDERNHLLRKPVDLDLLESLAGSVAAELMMINHTDFVPMRMRQSLSMQA